MKTANLRFFSILVSVLGVLAEGKPDFAETEEIGG
jgi:hypothetical protein